MKQEEVKDRMREKSCSNHLAAEGGSGFRKLCIGLLLLLVLSMWMNLPAQASTPLAANGRLQISQGKVVNEKGQPFTIKGVSTHGLAWYPQYVNQAAFKTLRDDWGVNTIRLAMYTAEYGGYCSGGDQEALKKLIDDGVTYATKLGMYVIIDWHILSDGNPLTYQQQAKAFFREIAKKYKDHKNVLYEICNEPNGSGGSWENIKKYAASVIQVIRKQDSKAIIIVGTPTWSQDVECPMSDPVTYDRSVSGTGNTKTTRKSSYNIAYAFHFYAGTHQADMRSRLEAALQAKLPVIVTEFGISEASGSGTANQSEGTKWIQLLDKYQTGRVCWSLSNKDETCSLIRAGCTKTSGWTTSDLTTEGKWLVRSYGKTASDSKDQTEDQTDSQSGETSKSEEQASDDAAAKTSKTTTAQKKNVCVKTSGQTKLKAVLKKVSSWTSGSSTFTQYKLTVKNTGKATASGWKIKATFTRKAVLSQNWNCKVTAKGKTITIRPVSWNKVLTSGQKVEVGLIVQSKGTIRLKKLR